MRFVWGLFCWLAVGVALLGQTPPAEFEALTITISVDGPRAVERWEGTIIYNDTPALGVVQYLPVYAASETDAAIVRELRVGERTVVPGPVRRTGRLLSWEIAAAAGERVRFVVEQPVSFFGDTGMWLVGARPTAFPVREGRLVFRAMGLTVVSRRAGVTGPEWALDKAANQNAPYFVASRFPSWNAFSAGMARAGVADREAVRKMADSLSRAGLRGRELVTAAEERVALERPYLQGLEAQAELAAVLGELGFAAERWMAGGAEDAVDPAAMTEALVRVVVDGESCWLRAGKAVAGRRALLLHAVTPRWETVDLGEGTVTATMTGRLGADGVLAQKTEMTSAGSLRLMGERAPAVGQRAGCVGLLKRSTMQPLLMVPLHDVPAIRGVYVEEMDVELPGNYAVTVNRNLEEDRPYARYRSEATTRGGRLRIRRELEVKEIPFPLGARAFWKLVEDDQKRPFEFLRTGAVDRERVLATVGFRENAAGLEAYDAREFGLAVEIFQRAIARNAKDAYAWNNLGRALAALGRLDEAVAAYEKQIEVNPKDKYSYNNLGLIHQRRKEWGKAVAAFRKQLEVAPGDRYATGNLPVAALEAGLWEEALAGPGPVGAAARICLGRAEDARVVAYGALRKGPTSLDKAQIAEALGRCGKELGLAEELIGAALVEIDKVREGSLSGRHFPSAFGYQTRLGEMLNTRASVARQLGKAVDGDGVALLEEGAGEVWVEMGDAAGRAPAGWVAGAAHYYFVVAGERGEAVFVDRLSELDVEAMEGMKLAGAMRVPVVEGAARTANILKLVGAADGRVKVYRARRFASVEILRVEAPERFR